MSVTVHQQPDSYTPALNPQIFVASSTQTAVSDFVFRVVCTDLITNETRTRDIKNWPGTTNLTFDAKNFTDNFIENFVINNAYGWERCDDAIRKIRVNIGEYYSSTYHAGTNIDYIIWNGLLRPIEWNSYASTDYVYNSDDSNVKYLSSGTAESGYLLPRGVTYEDRSHFLYCLTTTAGDAVTLRIRTYDSDGNLLGTSNIDNPYEGSYTYTDKYLAIDVGLKGLSEIGTLLVTGTYPIITSSVAYYTIDDISYLGSPAASTITPLMRMDVDCSPTFDLYTLHYKAKSGNYETLHFNKVSELTASVEKKSYRKNPNNLVSNTYSYSNFTEWEKTLSSTETESLILNTGYLTPAQFTQHREIISSPSVYIDYGPTTGLVPCKVNTNSLLINKTFNKKLEGITLQVEPTYKTNYGRG